MTQKFTQIIHLSQITFFNTIFFNNKHIFYRNMKLLHRVGLAPCLYAVFDNGLAYKYVSGVTLTVHSVIQPKVWKLVARQMAKMHQVQQDPEVSPRLQ